MDNRIGGELPHDFLPKELSLVAAARHIEWVAKTVLSLAIALESSQIEVTHSNLGDDGVEEYDLLDVHGSLAYVYQVLLNTTPEGMMTKHLRETTNPAAWN